MAVSLEPLIDNINSVLSSREREEAIHRIKSCFGETYSNQTELIPSLNLLAAENKISPSNTALLEEGIAEEEDSKSQVKQLVTNYKNIHAQEITELTQQQARDFIGRDVSKLGEKLKVHPGVILWGASGVGKTRFAKTFLNTWRGETKEIDLRGVPSIEVACVETLRILGRIVSIDDASINMVSHFAAEYDSKDTILLFDNADDFIKHPGEGADLTGDFTSLMEGILRGSEQRIRIIVTSREKSSNLLANEYLYQEQLKPLDENAASAMIERNMIHGKESTEVISMATDYCKNLPLNLQILGAALQDKGLALKDVLNFIKKEAKKWKTKEPKSSETEQFTFGVISTRFEQLSDTIQKCAVGLSLFTRSFSFTTIKQIFDSFKEQELFMILDCLRHVKFISVENVNTTDKSKMVYDMHPRVREFLSEKTGLEHITDFFQKTRKNFLVFFKEYLVNVSRLMDSDYLRYHQEYALESSNIDFLLKNISGDLIQYDSYEDLQLIGPLLYSILDPKGRLAFFQNLAEDLLQNGSIYLGLQFLCETAIAEGFYNPINALDFTTLRVEHILRKQQLEETIPGENKRHQNLEALYFYAKSQLLYLTTHSNHNIDDCNASLELVALSLKIREAMYVSKDHPDLVRSYVVKGNGHNMKKDLCKQGTREWHKNLDLAMEFYKKALEMRKRMSGSLLHPETPQICENIGTIHYQNKNYDEAERCFFEALEIEKELKLDGFYHTSTKKVNLGHMYQKLKRYKEAYECYKEACDIRKAFKGTHKDTVLTLYRMAEVKRLDKKYSEAVRLYIESFEMEERLPSNYHSVVHKKIRTQLVKTLDLRQRREATSEEEYNQFEADKRLWEEKIKALEEEEKRLETLQVSEAPRSPLATVIEFVSRTAISALGLRPKDTVMEPDDGLRPKDTVMEPEDGQRSVCWLVDELGGFVPFPYLGVYLTIPRSTVPRPCEFHVRRGNSRFVDLDIGEFLVSDVIAITSSLTEFRLASHPLLLEMPCKITIEDLPEDSHLSMIFYDIANKCWNEVERYEISMIDVDFCGTVKKFPTVQAWVPNLTAFAVISKPNIHNYKIGSEAQLIRPRRGNDDVEVRFSADTFKEGECECDIKIVKPTHVDKKYADGDHLALSPFINVQTSLKVFDKPVHVELPLLFETTALRPGGKFVVLKKDSKLSSGWNELKDLQLTLEASASFQVTGFSWLVVAWVKDTTFQVTDLAFSTFANIFSNKFLATFHLYANFPLYKSAVFNRDVLVAVSCVPLTCSRDEQEDLRTRPMHDGKFHVRSQPSLEKVYDSEKALVTVTGPFQNGHVDTGKRMIRLSKETSSPTHFRTKRTGEDVEEGDVEITRKETDELLCNIPYSADSTLCEKDEFHKSLSLRESPFRFLGLKLEHCGLENVKVTHNLFKNNLYKTGMHETYVEEIGLSDGKVPAGLITKELLARISYMFSDGKLERDWFGVFRENLWPDDARKNLIQVMDFLESKNGKDIAKKCLFHDPSLPSFIGELSRLMSGNTAIKHPSYGKKNGENCLISDTIENCQIECEKILEGFYGESTVLLDVVRKILLLKDTFPLAGQRILDNMGKWIEKCIGIDST